MTAESADSRVEPPGAVARILLVGISTRAMAESAVRAGYRVLSVDAYADRDNPASPALALRRDFGVEYSARAIATAAVRGGLDQGCDAVCYGSSLENHPREVALLASRAALWGNQPQVLRRARSAVALSRLLRTRLGTGALTRASAADASREWLIKPRASGGGHGIAAWHSGDLLPRTHVLQEHISGTPGSIAFVARAGRAFPFAISRQLVGEADFGAAGFQYCGSILGAFPRSVVDAASDSAELLAEELRLSGVASLDFIVSPDGIPLVIELNPRYSASMELAERAFGYSVFAAHAHACAEESGRSRGRRGAAAPPPSLDLSPALRSVGAVGKAVLFARSTVEVPDTTSWLADPDVRDIPHSGEIIPRGHPVCTIFATASDDISCHAMLARKAREMYDRIGKRDGRRVRRMEKRGEGRRQGAGSSKQKPHTPRCRPRESGDPCSVE